MRGRTTATITVSVLLSALALTAASAAPGPDTRDCPTDSDRAGIGTLSDLYGPAGESLQAAVGFFVAEGDATTSPSQGFGLTIDDMVIRWRETELVPDVTECSAGFCATLELQTTNFYEGNSRLEISLLEASPPAENDCDLNGIPDGTHDCSGDGVPDLVVRATSDAEIDGEIVFVERVGSGPRYRGSLPISPVYDVSGTLFIERSGTLSATVDVVYDDSDDGTGSPCANSADPAERGNVRASTAVFYPVGRLSVAGYRLTDNGDDDGFADTNETVDLYVTVVNQSGEALGGVVARLSTNSARVDCILQPVISIGSLDADGPGSRREGPAPFRFKLGAGVERGSEFEELAAAFTVSITSNRFDGLISPQRITLDLDLDVSGGGSPTEFSEDFETAGSLGAFTSMSLDFNGPGGPGGSNTASDGYRCQYNDPDFINSNSYCPLSDCVCHLGYSLFPVIPDSFDWHQHGALQPDGGRAYIGGGSLHFGVHDASGDPDLDTTPLATLDAVRLIDPLNLSYAAAGGTPELSFKHQISLVDNRGTSTPTGEAVDRGVVQLQLADGAGAAIGSWQKLYPYHNVHDAQGTDNFVDCTFDPTDDGNDEDDFFDPTDPNRRLGPSSTCFPEASFVFLGDTDHRNPPSPFAIGRASDGPGLAGATGPGTWVESRFDLSRFQGRRVRLRFLETSIEVDPIANYESAFSWNPVPLDDGWYVDAVRVAPTLTSPATVAVDTADNSALPGCGNACDSLGADLVADPSTVAAPGALSELSAAGSSADRCIDGTLQYQFWRDSDDSGTIDTAVDERLRDWTDNPLLLAVPRRTTTYGAFARCSSAPACAGSATPALATVVVNCPATGNVRFTQRIVFSGPDDVGWPVVETVDAIRGNLNDLRAASGGGAGDFGTSVETCVLDGVPASGFSDATVPPNPGDARYWLVRSAACNAPGWGSGGPGEVPGRDSTIPASTCP
jgi:hypothetical protein